MDTSLIGIVLPAAVAALVMWQVAMASRRRKTLRELRSDWGKPRDRERDMESIQAYYRSLDPDVEGIDDRTWRDLDFDLIFADIDRTESTLGQQALYHRLRMAPEEAKLDAFEALVARMQEDPGARDRARRALRRLTDRAGYNLWWLTDPDVVDRKPGQLIYPLLTLAVLSLLVLSVFSPGFLLLLVLAFGVNMVLRGVSNSRIVWILPAFRQVSSLLGIADLLRFLEGDEIDPLVGPLRRELPKLRRLKRISRWVSLDPFSMPEIVGALWSYLNLLFLIDLNAVYFGSAELGQHTAALVAVIAAVGDVDAAISVASFRSGSVDWTRPAFVPPGTSAVLGDLRHPLVEDAVPNSIGLGPPHGVLVTGSNMSGKTTFLKTVGVNVVLSQTIHTCLAAEYRAPKMVVESFIGRSDDLVRGKSYYLVEVEGVLARVADSMDDAPHLFLFDELFRGTNAVERIAASEAVLTELIVGADSDFKPHFVLAAVHDLELVDLLRDTYTACHFADQLGEEGLSFDHKLRPGPTSSRNAIALLRLNGAPDSLVARAEARASLLDRYRHPAAAPSEERAT
jgi:MutS domain V